MKAFIVSVNGQKVCTAGIDEGLLSTSFIWAGGGPFRTRGGRLRMHLFGLDLRSKEYVPWRTPRLRVGDSVTVQVAEVDEVDPELDREPTIENLRGFRYAWTNLTRLVRRRWRKRR